MKNTITLLLFITTLCSFAQKKAVSNDDPIKYMNTITAEKLKTRLYVVASDEMEGRETGSKGQKKAGQYLIEQYKKSKISFPKGAISYYQPIPASFLNAKRNENLPDSENIWAYVEGS